MFKETFKYYKSKNPFPDFSEIIDLDSPTKTAGLDKLGLSEDRIPSTLPPGVIPVRNWMCYQLNQHPGLLVIHNPFTTQGQRYWIARSLRDYPKTPNVVNLNAKLFSQLVIDDWWQELQSCSNDEERRMKLAMRWTTLGYHHDWDSKIYSEEMRTQFPSDLAKLTCWFSKVLGFEDFNAEAAIINYYPIGTTLAGHTDHSEVNLEAPLFSFSFGQTAIFLIGGKTKEERPTAIFLKSGDVVVMSRVARLCYHAVPRIIQAQEEPWNKFLRRNTVDGIPCKQGDKSEIENVLSEWSLQSSLYEQVTDEVSWAPFKNYLTDSRININVRQVLYTGHKSL